MLASVMILCECVLDNQIGVSDVGESFRCDDDWCDGVMMDV